VVELRTQLYKAVEPCQMKLICLELADRIMQGAEKFQRIKNAYCRGKCRAYSWVLTIVLDDLAAIGLRIQDVGLLVGVFEVVDIFLQPVVVLGRGGRCSGSAVRASAVKWSLGAGSA
jgi:hypothetical protein